MNLKSIEHFLKPKVMVRNSKQDKRMNQENKRAIPKSTPKDYINLEGDRPSYLHVVLDYKDLNF